MCDGCDSLRQLRATGEAKEVAETIIEVSTSMLDGRTDILVSSCVALARTIAQIAECQCQQLCNDYDRKVLFQKLFLLY
jgi:hypothetical protein